MHTSVDVNYEGRGNYAFEEKKGNCYQSVSDNIGLIWLKLLQGCSCA